MNEIGNALLKIAGSIVLFVGAIVGVVSALVIFVDSRYGNTAGSVVGLVGVGVVIAGALIVIAILLTNQTHRAAGEDVVHAFSGGVKAIAEAQKIAREKERGDQAVRVTREKGLLEEKKRELGFRDYVRRLTVKDERKAEQEERKREEEQRATEAEYAWLNDIEDGDFTPLEID